MVERAVGADADHVEPVRCPRDGVDRLDQDAAEPVPPGPARAVPGHVVERRVGADAEDVEPVRPRRDDLRPRDQNPAAPVPARPDERDLRGRVALQANTGEDRVVVVAVLCDELLVVRRREQPVVAVGDAVDGEELAGQARRVDVGPADRDALVAAGVIAACPRRGGVCTLDVHEAEGLLEAGQHLLPSGVQQFVDVEVFQVVVAVRGGPDEDARVARRGADVKVGVTGVVG